MNIGRGRVEEGVSSVIYFLLGSSYKIVGVCLFRDKLEKEIKYVMFFVFLKLYFNGEL